MKALRGILAISQPIKQGVVQNWDDLEVNSSRNLLKIFFYKIMVFNPSGNMGAYLVQRTSSRSFRYTSLTHTSSILYRQMHQPYSHIQPPSSTGRYTGLTHTSSILYRQIYQPYSHILHPLQVDIPALLTHPPSSTVRYTSHTHTPPSSTGRYISPPSSTGRYTTTSPPSFTGRYTCPPSSSILYRQIYQSSIIFDGKKRKIWHPKPRFSSILIHFTQRFIYVSIRNISPTIQQIKPKLQRNKIIFKGGDDFQENVHPWLKCKL